MIAPRSGVPIVVGGCYRTGTSLVRRILDAHPRIHCGPELPFFRDLHGDYRDDPYAHLRFSANVSAVLGDDERLAILGGAYLEVHERAAEAAGKPRWADKNPDNARYLADWQALLGSNWLYLHVVRDPLDTVASMTDRGFPLTLPPTVREKADLYVELVAAGLAFARAWPERTYVLRYEDLVSRPSAAVAAVMRWAGEDPHERQLRFNEVPHQVGLEDPKVAETAGVHDEAIGTWRRILTDDEAQTVLDVAADLWRQLADESVPASD